MKSSEPSEPQLHSGQQPLSPSAVSLTLLTVALWGGTPVAISYSVDVLPPIAVAGLRFVLAAVFMLFWCKWEGSSLALKPGQWWPSFITGFLLFLQISLFHVGVAMSSSSHGTLFINTFIFWVIGIEHFVTKAHRMNVRKTVGLAFAALGVLLLLIMTGKVSGGSPQNARDVATITGDIILLGSGCLLGIKVLYTKYAVSKVEPGKLIFWHDVVGVFFFAVYSLLFERFDDAKMTVPAFWGLMYQGVVVAGFCFAVQAQLLRKHAASQLSVYSFATPLFGITLAVLFRGDVLSPWLLAAVVGVAGGIYMVNSGENRVAKTG